MTDRLRLVKHGVLEDLIETIKAGRCVAFVGAGFSADTSGQSDLETVGR